MLDRIVNLTVPAILMLWATTTQPSIAGMIEAGEYYIVAKHSYKALTVFETPEGQVDLGQMARSEEFEAAQVWTIAASPENADSYVIRSDAYGMVLAVGGENENGDTSVILAGDSEDPDQAWRLHRHSNSYSLEAGDSGLGLNVTGRSLADDAMVIIYDLDTADNAQWLLYPAAERQVAAAQLWDRSEIDNADRIYRLIAMPPAAQEADRLRRMRLMDYQPSGIHVRRGEKVSMTVSGLTASPDGLTIMVGPMNSYEGATEKSEPQMVAAREGNNEFTAAHNGMIYFLYVDSGFNADTLPPLEIEITEGGSPVPLFIAGQTSTEDWRAMLSDYPADSYVEMMNDTVLITATRRVYDHTNQGDPEAILDLLQQILGWYDELSGLDGSSPLHAVSSLRLHYQQDLVSSKETLDGIYMYAADYFVGVPGENMADLLELSKLRQAWSIWHETGHKYQQSDWTWPDVVETTVNIYSLAAQANLGHPSRLAERDGETGKSPLDQARRYLARKYRDFTDARQMRSTPDDDGEYWVRLVMFDQLRQAFGDGFYPALHRYYRENPLSDAAGRDQNAQIQAFIVASSRVSKYDLTSFFEDWGVLIDPETQEEVRYLRLPAAEAELSTLGLDE